MSPDYYRRVWNTDMLNKLLDKRIPWNPGLSRDQLIGGFTELMMTGVYERPYFGDMMMAGIACGVRKRILIFNTNENIATTGHDPVSVIDPTQHGGYVDSDVPIVIAYDLVHFESLHPVDRQDIDKMVRLIRSYTAHPSRYEEDYGFTRKDIRYLITKNVCMPQLVKLKSHKEGEAQMEEVVAKIRDVGAQMEDIKPQNEHEGPQIDKKEPQVKNKEPSLEENHPHEKSSPRLTEKFEFWDITFKELENGKMICGICQTECQRLLQHLNKCLGSKPGFNLENFKIEYDKYRARQRKRKQEDKQRKKDLDKFKADVNKRKADSEAKKKAEDLEKFKNEAKKRLAQHEAKKKAEDSVKFKNDAKKRKAQHETKKKAEDLEKFKTDAKKRKDDYEAKKKTEDLEKFKTDAKKRKDDYEAKKKAEDSEKFKNDAKKRKAQHEARKKADDLEKFRNDARRRKATYNSNVCAEKRIAKFKKKVQFGPIFVCSCCHQKLFEHQVLQFTDKLKEDIDHVNPGARAKYIEDEIPVDLGKDDGSV